MVFVYLKNIIICVTVLIALLFVVFQSQTMKGGRMSNDSCRGSRVMKWSECRDCFLELRALEEDLWAAIEAKGQNLPHACIDMLKSKVSQLQNRIAVGNQCIVKHVAREIYGQVDYEALLSAGDEGLLNAINRFDPQLGFRFSTYAYTALKRQMIQTASRENRERNRRLASARDIKLLQRKNDRPYDDDMLQKLNRVVLCLDDEREKMVLSCRYGLDNKEVLTRKQIGRALGITRERVRQIEKKVLSKLRKYFGSELLS